MVFETLVAAVEAGASPDTVRLTLPQIGQWPNTTALIRPAIARDDFDTLQVLADGERYAATFLWVEAIAAGCPPDVVLALRGAPPSWKWRRRLRIAARDQGWSKEDIQSLLH